MNFDTLAYQHYVPIKHLWRKWALGGASVGLPAVFQE